MQGYELLREKLDLFPVGFRKQSETDEMLRLLFTEEEALIASHVPMPPIMRPARRIARKAGMNRRQVELALESMVEKNLIAGNKVLGETLYMLVPAYPGFIEAQFMQGVEQTDARKRVGELWHAMYDGPMGKEAHGYPTAGMRVVPIKKTIDTTQRVFNYEEMKKVIEKSGAVSITDCACRKTAQKCDRPLDVCMVFGPLAVYSAEKGISTKVSTKEAILALDRAAGAGLIHLTNNCKPPISIVCNCCTCCCSSLKGVTALNKPASSVASNFACDPSGGPGECKLCKACVKACPMEALAVDEKTIALDEEKCLGCGVCVSKCKHEAMTMKRVNDKKPFPSTLHMMAKVIEERGKLPRILENLPKDIF